MIPENHARRSVLQSKRDPGELAVLQMRVDVHAQRITGNVFRPRFRVIQRAFAAILEMKKPDIAALERASVQFFFCGADSL